MLIIKRKEVMKLFPSMTYRKLQYWNDTKLVSCFTYTKANYKVYKFEQIIKMCILLQCKHIKKYTTQKMRKVLPRLDASLRMIKNIKRCHIYLIGFRFFISDSKIIYCDNEEEIVYVDTNKLYKGLI